MIGVTAALLGAAGLGALGSLGGSVASAIGQARANNQNVELMRESMAFNAAEAQKARNFEERMSNTSYQRAVKDLQAAGLNPALAYQQGGSSSPSAAVATGSAGSVGNTLSSFKEVARGIESIADSINSAAGAMNHMKAVASGSNWNQTWRGY